MTSEQARPTATPVGSRPERLDRQPLARVDPGGQLRELIEEDAVVGATSNPTIFQKAMPQGTPTTSRSRS